MKSSLLKIELDSRSKQNLHILLMQCYWHMFSVTTKIKISNVNEFLDYKRDNASLQFLSKYNTYNPLILHVNSKEGLTQL